jgi:hypothetical protein
MAVAWLTEPRSRFSPGAVVDLLPQSVIGASGKNDPDIKAQVLKAQGYPSGDDRKPVGLAKITSGSIGHRSGLYSPPGTVGALTQPSA